MQSTKLAAGPIAPRTNGDAPTPENSSATTCDECNARDAAGINPDGRSLCRPCATRSRTLVCDGSGFSEEDVFEAALQAESAIVESTSLTSKYNVRHDGHHVILDTAEGIGLPTSLTEKIEREASLRFCGAFPEEYGLRAEFRLVDDRDDHDDALHRLAREFQNRHEQANISKQEYAERDENRAADFEQGRVLAFQDARAAVLAVRDGDSDD